MLNILRFIEQQSSNEQHLLYGVEALLEPFKPIIPQCDQLFLSQVHLLFFQGLLMHFREAVEIQYFLKFADLLKDEHSLHALLVGEVEHLSDLVVDRVSEIDYQLLSLVVSFLVDLEHCYP